MIDKNIKISSLQNLLDQKYGPKVWIDWEPETIMHDLEGPDYLVMEKIYVLQALNHNVNRLLELPEFILWTTAVTNNNYADFDVVTLPTSLELAWMIEEVKRVAKSSNQSFIPTLELSEILTYLLKEDGFSCSLYPFEFIPENLLAKKDSTDLTELKNKAIKAYITYMDKEHA